MIIYRIKNFFKALLIVLASTLILVVCLEIFFRFVGTPGTGKFIAQVLNENSVSRSKKGIDFRVFLLGESTMHGWQYAPDSTIGTWLDQYLKTLLPDEKVQIVNFARLGEGSAFCLECMKELLPYCPDLFVVYVGHNDFYPGNRRNQVEEEANLPKNRFKRLLRKSYLFAAVERLAYSVKSFLKGDRTREDPVEVVPRGLAPDEISPVGSPEYEDCLRYYRENTEAMIRLAQKAGVSIIFFKVVSNARDFSPNHSAFSRNLDDNVKKLYLSRLSEAKRLLNTARPAEAAQILDDLLRVDGRYADTLYLRAQAAEAMGLYDEARLFYLEAVDCDAVHNRAPRHINQILEELCRQYHVPLIDAVDLLESASPNSIIGCEMIDDNCHPTVRGQSIMARELARTISGEGWIAPFSKWRWSDEEPFEAYAKQLGVNDDMYFAAYLRLAGYLGSRHEEALNYIGRALQLKPEAFEAQRHLAWRYWIVGRKNEALSIYRKLLRDYPDKTKKILKKHPEITP